MSSIHASSSNKTAGNRPRRQTVVSRSDRRSSNVVSSVAPYTHIDATKRRSKRGAAAKREAELARWFEACRGYPTLDDIRTIGVMEGIDTASVQRWVRQRQAGAPPLQQSPMTEDYLMSPMEVNNANEGDASNTHSAPIATTGADESLYPGSVIVTTPILDETTNIAPLNLVLETSRIVRFNRLQMKSISEWYGRTCHANGGQPPTDAQYEEFSKSESLPKEKIITTCRRAGNGSRWQKEYDPGQIIDRKLRPRVLKSTARTISTPATSSTVVGESNRSRRTKRATSGTAPYSLDSSARKKQKDDGANTSTIKPSGSTSKRNPKIKREEAVPSLARNVGYTSMVNFPRTVLPNFEPTPADMTPVIAIAPQAPDNSTGHARTPTPVPSLPILLPIVQGLPLVQHGDNTTREPSVMELEAIRILMRIADSTPNTLHGPLDSSIQSSSNTGQSNENEPPANQTTSSNNPVSAHNESSHGTRELLAAQILLSFNPRIDSSNYYVNV